SSTPNSNRTAIGSTRAITATCIARVKRPAVTGGLTRMVTGFTLTRVGPGFQTNRSVGRLIITAAGRGFAVSAGFGCRATNGRRRGSRGAKAAIMLDGPRYRQKHASITEAVSTTGLTTTTTFDP